MMLALLLAPISQGAQARVYMCVDPETGYAKTGLRYISRGDMTGVLRPQNIKPEEW